MRRLLLATTALVGGVAFAGAAHAAPAPTSPITLNVGGYVDFVAGFYHESQGTDPTVARTSRDFEDEFKINFDAMGKANNGMQYGANVSLWNGPEATNYWAGGGNTVTLASAYVWLSGAFGKAMFGDDHGASDLFVYAPTVGEGQIDGRYMDFVSAKTLDRMYASGIDNTEHSTNVTYYTPKVGNDNNKVQMGITYAPTMYDYGSNVVKFDSNSGLNDSRTVSPYQDIIKGDIAYWGNFRPVSIVASGQIETGSASSIALSNTTLGGGSNTPSGLTAQDFTAWGLGTQVGFAGFTVGGSWNDLGRYNTTHGQNKAQENWTLGGKYEFDKVAVGVSYLNGEGYNNLFNTTGGNTIATTTTQTNYVSNFDAYGVGATYTWFPGLTSNVDGVLFNQDVRDQRDHNDGYVLLISQKMTF